MIRLFAAACLFPITALADAPKVITDIAPIHSLTAQVMGNLGSPDILLPPGTDPHDFSLRPSDASRLSGAELVIWVGEGLTPWLHDPLETLAPAAQQLILLETSGWDRLSIRDLEEMSADDEHHTHDDHGHDDHGHDDHGHGDHGHGDFDPHAWADPVVAGVWIAAIADQLSAVDPENAGIYQKNALMAQADLLALQTQINAQLQPLQNRAYVLPHDGYQYFEARFGLAAKAALSGVDARTPGPAQIASLRDHMEDDVIVCVFNDIEVGEQWATLLIEGTETKTATIDAVGVGLQAGPMLYADMLLRLGDNFAKCLRP